ncbi:conjugal transfer protein TrbC (plasmid) [Escherichia coli UMNF18]|nr:conjugal transfer protein TrbC [Escherichia coli UMNF18]
MADTGASGVCGQMDKRSASGTETADVSPGTTHVGGDAGHSFCGSRLRYGTPPVTGGNAMKRVMVSLALLLVSGGGMANNHTENRQFIHEQLQLDRQRFQSLQTPEFLKQTRPVAPQEQSFLDAQAQQFRQSMQPGERPVNAALVFVSFSMPAEELKQRVKDAAQLNIPVVIRGMVNGDMRATANAVAGLVKESNTGGVQIDPTTFRKYNITAVPVLVVACGNQGEKVDRLQGDLTLHQALKRVAEEGDCADTARSLLGEGGE